MSNSSNSSLPPYSSPSPSYTDRRQDDAPQYPHPPSLPTFRQRKSSTIISINASPSSSDTSGSPDSSLRNSMASLNWDHPASPSRAGRGSIHEDEEAEGSMTPGSVKHERNETLERRVSSESARPEEGENTPLLGREAKGKWYQSPLFVAGVKLAVLFVVFTAVLVATFWLGMPTLDPEDKGTVKLPRSFADLQALNALFQKYKEKYPLPLLACGVVSYLFVQTFSLPGSMYISILFGAAYGMLYGLLLSCLCESVGALLCYTLSAILAPPLLSMPFYRARVETWRLKIMGDPKNGKQVTWDGVLAFLIVLRVAPFPPHWIANFVAPHLGIGPILFWFSCFVGIAPVSVIHVTIGSSLDSMTSADDLHILSVRNVLGLCAVVVAVLIPVGLKRVFRKDLGELGEAEEILEEETVQADSVNVPAVHAYNESYEDGAESLGVRKYQAIDSGVVLAGPSEGDPDLDIMPVRKDKGKGRQLEIIADVDEDDEDGYTFLDSRGQADKVYVQPQLGGQRHLAHEKARAKRFAAPLTTGYGTIDMPAREELSDLAGRHRGFWSVR